TKQAMPVIRYRTGDLTRLLPGTARSMRRMEKITGRTDDMIILRGVNVFPTQIEELLLQEPDLAPHFQCILDNDGPLGAMTVTTEPGPASSTEAAERATRRLAERIKNTIGVTVTVQLTAAGSIERSTGKMRRIVDRRRSA
ncbi:MAG TPA: phenylacetate--CoA ligase, partial [Micromonosporaceae bacterium]